MKDPISALLIIGCAVVGPIESQRTNVGPITAGDTSNARETIAQTCERAMKEIGAKQQNNGEWHIEWGKDGILVKFDAVRCIPAPSGLKR